MDDYAELDLITNFSFLEGASHAGELIIQAKTLGLAALGVADRNTLAGIVRAHVAAKKHGVRLLVGSRLVFRNGTELIVYPRDREAYGRLSRLLSDGKRDAAKAETRLEFAQAAGAGEGLIAIAPAPWRLTRGFAGRLAMWRAAWPDTLYLGLAPLHRGDDIARIARGTMIAVAAGAPLVATNAVRYHHPDRRPLQDVLTCIRDKTTIADAGHRLAANAERFLKPAAEMRRLFGAERHAVERSLTIVEACRFSLDELRYHYPDEPVPPGTTPQAHLEKLSWAGAELRYPAGVPPKVRAALIKELRLIERLEYAAYFLTVHDIVAWAIGQGILCQGRGSAANSAVCFCLSVTSVDPAEQDLLFERFLSAERREPPDIDIDFEHERREEVIQYIYARYGRERAAIAATVISYRPRSAIRDVGKVLGLSEDVTGAMASTVWGSFGSEIPDAHVVQAGLDPGEPRIKQALALAHELLGFPRHLSQHVGGFVLTQGPLVETVPIGNGAMPDRTFIEWDKDDIDALGIMKVDVLALGMLTAIAKAFRMIAAHYNRPLTLATLPQEDLAVYDMLCRADSLGVFQVESRAQMNMLPRLRPRCFYDLVVEVAIVRPGPIQGDMVHPYLKQRKAREAAAKAGQPFHIDYPRPAPEHGPANELELVLGKTLGVPLFQEQAMRIAMSAAKFTGDEANGLRRAMATFRYMGTIHQYEEMMVSRMIERGYDPAFAVNCFNQIKGFGEYGFPESHAASFALLVYVSSWIKCHYPDVFAAALLNSQPMGFYAPAQIVRCAQAHGVEVLPVDVTVSGWDNHIEQRGVLRLGLRQISGFRQAWAEAAVASRPITSLAALRHVGLPAEAVELLAAADALGSLTDGRRTGLWAARGLPLAAALPLFAAAGLDEDDGAPPATLPAPAASEEVVSDYETLRLSLKGHPMGFLRARAAVAGAIPCAALSEVRDGRAASVTGVVLVRQRPGSAKGVCFITLEDETGIANIVCWPDVFERFRARVMGGRLLRVTGRVQRSEGVTHLVAVKVEDVSAELNLLSDGLRLAPPTARGDEATRGGPETRDLARHPRDVRLIPKSRDFH